MKQAGAMLPAILILLATACVSQADRAEEIASGAFAGGNYTKSLTAARVLIGQEPDYPLGYIIAGDSLVELKRYREAEVCYEALLRVLERQPEPEATIGEVAATRFKLQRVREGRGWTRPELVGAIMRGVPADTVGEGTPSSAPLTPPSGSQ